MPTGLFLALTHLFGPGFKQLCANAFLYVTPSAVEGTSPALLGAMGMGAPYFVLRYLLGFAGDAEAAGYKYGTVFLLSAGLMNLLLVLDTWDIGTGRKE